MNRNRRTESSDEEKTDLWLLTYSDMVTLCLAFFVLLYSFSTLDTMKWKSVLSSLQGALGVMDGSKIPATQPDENIYDAKVPDDSSMDEYLKYQEERKKLEEIRDRLNEYLAAQGLNENITTSIEERGVVIRLQDSVLFPKGSADLYPQSAVALAGMCSIFREIKNPIKIEGHTDTLPIHTTRFPSNWELSTSRATNVLRYLIKESVPGERLSAVGYGEFHPVAPNDCEENRRKNRRVDIVLIRESLIINEPK